MAALTAAASRKARALGNSVVAQYTVATGSTVYAGGLLAFDTDTGRVKAATAAVKRSFAGEALETKTGDTAGTVKCKVMYKHESLFALTASVLTNVHERLNRDLVVKNDNEVTTATDGGTAAKRVYVGEFIQFDTAVTGWISIRSYCGRVAATA